MADELNLTATETTPADAGTADVQTDVSTVETGTTTAAGDDKAGKPGETKVPEPLIKDGKVNQTEAFNLLRELKAKNPEHARQLKAALYDHAALRAQFPGGMREVTETITQIEQLGGLEGLPKLKESAEELSRIDDLYAKADPGFVDGMIESNPEAFKALMPVAIEKFKQGNLEGFWSIIAPDILAGFDQRGGVRDAIEGLLDVAKSNPDIAKHVQALVGYYNSIFDLTQKAPKPGQRPPAQNAAPDPAQQRETELLQREQALVTKEWDGARGQIHRTAFNAEMSRIMAGKPMPTDQQRAAIGTLYMSNMERAARDQKHRSTVDRYRAANDLDGYKRYMQGWYRTSMPRALSTAVDTIISHTKAAPAPRPQAAARPGQPTAKPAESFKPVSTKPGAREVDFSRTTKEMYYTHKKAVLKDGRKVSW